MFFVTIIAGNSAQCKRGEGAADWVRGPGALAMGESRWRFLMSAAMGKQKIYEKAKMKKLLKKLACKIRLRYNKYSVRNSWRLRSRKIGHVCASGNEKAVDRCA